VKWKSATQRTRLRSLEERERIIHPGDHKLVEGNYPNYRQVIPSETKERIALSREELMHALRRAEIMTSEKSNSVKMAFGKNKLEITANSPEVGEAKETLESTTKART